MSLNLDFSDETNYNIVGLSENHQFIYINGQGDHSTGQTNYGYKYLYIVNLKNNTYLEIQYYSSIVFWAPDENDPSESNITKEIFTLNGIFSIPIAIHKLYGCSFCNKTFMETINE